MKAAFRRSLCVVLALQLATPTAALAGEDCAQILEPEPGVFVHDLDGDGQIDAIRDAMRLLRWYFNGSAPPVTPCAVGQIALLEEENARLAADNADLEAENANLSQRLDEAWTRWRVEDGGNGHWYRLTAPGTWQEAENEANANGGHLVTVNDAAEQDWLTQQFPPPESFWIGLRQDPDDPEFSEPAGGWKWISGEPSTYRRWAASEPNEDTRFWPTEDRARMHCFGAGQWCDAYGDSDQLRGIVEVSCEAPPPPDVPGFQYICRNPDTQLDEYRHEETGIEFVLLPGGVFDMGAQPDDPGAPNHDPDAQSSESPVHTVVLSPFLIAKLEVTQERWRAVLDAHPEITLSTPSPDFPGDDFPIHQVSWSDCKTWLAAVGLDLPTEAQWEYACRAGTTSVYHSGDTVADLTRAAWWDGNSGDMAHAVAGKEANAFGLHDMHGNVFEWCEDWYDPGFYGTPQALEVDPVNTTASGERVIRGGGWDSIAEDSRSARRRGHPNRGSDIGFRPVAPLP